MYALQCNLIGIVKQTQRRDMPDEHVDEQKKRECRFVFFSSFLLFEQHLF